MMPMLLFFLTHLFGLTQDLYSAQAVGDRFRVIDTIRKLRGLLGDIDPTKFAGGVSKLVEWLTANPAILGWIKQLLGSMTLGGAIKPSAHAMSFAALTDDDYAAAGILDNPSAWMGLVQALIALAKLIWGADVIPFATTEMPRIPAAEVAAPAPAPAAPIDANATK